jgi:hypothetical protein
MRLALVLLLVLGSLFPAAARKRNKVWLPGTVGVVNTDKWCKLIGIRGTCGTLLDSGRYGPPAPVGPELSAAVAVGPEVGPAPVPSPVTQIIQIDGAKSSYTVRCESLGKGLTLHLGISVEFAIEGKHLFLRQARNEYKTDILAATNKP